MEKNSKYRTKFCESCNKSRTTYYAFVNERMYYGCVLRKTDKFFVPLECPYYLEYLVEDDREEI